MRIDERETRPGLSAFEVLIETQGDEYNQSAPLFFSPRMWERLLGELPVVTGWHVSDIDNLPVVIKYQHKQNTISVATKPTRELLRGLRTDGEVALKLSGQRVFGSARDFFTHRLTDGQKIKRRDLPKPLAEALAKVWVNVIAWGLEQYLLLRSDWDVGLRRTLEEALTETRNPYTEVVLASKSVSAHRVLGSVLRKFFREPFEEYKLNLTDEEKRTIGRIKQQMIAKYLQGQEQALVPHLETLTDIGSEHASWDETLLTNYTILRAIIYGGDDEQRTQAMKTLEQQDIPYESIKEEILSLVDLARSSDPKLPGEEVLAQMMKEGVLSNALTGAVSGLVSGSIAGRSAGRRAARNQMSAPNPTTPSSAVPPKPTADQIPPRPTEDQVPSNPQQPQQKSGLGAKLKTATSGLLNTARTVAGGGDPAARQALKSFASGDVAAELAAKDPQRASQHLTQIMQVLGKVGQLSLEKPQAGLEENVNLFRQRYIEKMDTGEILKGIQQFFQIVGDKGILELTDNELESFQTLGNALSDKRIRNQLVQHAQTVGDAETAQALQNLDLRYLPQTVELVKQNREQLQGAAPQPQKAPVMITPEMKPARLHGAITNSFQSLDPKRFQSIVNELRVIIEKYGQINNLTVYTWDDLQTIVEVLKEYGAPIDIDVSSIKDLNTTPAGGASAPATSPQEQSSPEVSNDFVGQVVQKMQQDPEMIKDLIKYAIEKNPKNKTNLAQKYDIPADVLE